jgi:two-component system, NarL family, sensor histidine kinase DesK
MKKNNIINKNFAKVFSPGFSLVLISFFSHAQTITDSAVDATAIQFASSINEYVLFETCDKPVADDSIPFLNFTKKIPGKTSMSVPYEMVSKTVYLKFLMKNTSDSLLHVYLFPGFYYTEIEVFSARPENIKTSFSLIKRLPETDSSNYEGFGQINILPRQTEIFYVKLSFAKTPVNVLAPRIINSGFINYFKTAFLAGKGKMGLITYLVSGILLMMIFYSLAVYFQNLNIEFLYYSGYAFSMGILLFLKSALLNTNTPFNYFFESYLDFFIQFCGYIFYLVFVRKFLDTKQHYPFLEKLFLFGEWVIFILLSLFSITYFFTSKITLLGIIENSTKQFLLVIGIIFIVYGLRKKDKLMNYLVAGQLILILFSIISFLLIVLPIHFVQPRDGTSSIFNDSLLYYETGLVLELIFFLSGLAYKNKNILIERIKEKENLILENERKEFEKQVAVLEGRQEERNRISADMHDELGSGVTAIRLMSEIVKAKMKNQNFPEIEKISSSANDLLNKMNTIIWTMISSNDSVESLVAYVRAYTMEFFENTQVDCHFNISHNISPAELNGEKRRNIFLSVKEALNNVLKHAQALNVNITITTENGVLLIEIADDGTGINPDKIRQFSNGIGNMKKRIESINGEFSIAVKNGTIIKFTLKI